MSSKTLVAIDAGTILTPEDKFSPGRMLIEGSLIAAVGTQQSIRIPAGADYIHAADQIVAPGFIDPHIHGCGGVDVMQATFESLNAVSRILVRHGTTSFLPTTVSAPPAILVRTVEQLGAAMSRSFEGAEPLGIHLEGPFISPEKRGTHKAINVISPSLDLLESCVNASGRRVRLLTIAPELEGIDELLILAKHLGLTVAMGHSNATLGQAKAAAANGVCYAVHTFNAMRVFSHRDPGITGEVLSNDRIFAEIISDGIHVDPAVVQIFARAKGKARVLLVTDGTSATDMPDGQYRLGGDTVDVINGTCRDEEGRLAGSTLTQEVALRNFVEWSGWQFEDALHALTRNPAAALKLEGKGILEAGAAADVVILDTNFHVLKTLVGGRVVFSRS